MKKSTKKVFIGLLVIVLSVGAVGCNSATGNGPETNNESEHVDLAMGAGNVSGVFYSLVSAMAEIIMTDMDNVTITPKTTVSAACPEAIQQDAILAGVSQTAAIADGMAGKEPYTEKTTKVRQMLALHPMPLQIILRAEAGIKTIEDLKGRSVVPLNAGTAGEKCFKESLSLYDMTADDMGQCHYISGSDGINLLKNRQADALFIANATPLAYILDLQTNQQVDLIDFPQDKIEQYISTYDGYSAYTIPAGTYEHIQRDIHTVAPRNILAVSEDLPEDLVYEMTKAVVENREKLGDVIDLLKGVTPEELGAQTNCPMHPGAEKYFREIGVIK